MVTLILKGKAKDVFKTLRMGKNIHGSFTTKEMLQSLLHSSSEQPSPGLGLTYSAKN